MCRGWSITPFAYPGSVAERLSVEFSWRPAGSVVADGAGNIRFPSVDEVPGIYRFDLLSSSAPARAYVGQTDRLRRRMQHYRTPGPSQTTNVRLKALVLGLLAEGGTVDLLTCTSAIVETSAAPRRPLDLRQKGCRVLVEHAALVSLVLQGVPVENL